MQIPTHVFVKVINLTQRASKEFQQSRRIASKSYSVNEYTVEILFVFYTHNVITENHNLLLNDNKYDVPAENTCSQPHRCHMSIHAHLDVNACRVYHSTECTREREGERESQ
uniref:Uncharacterized protein n=1 Tax=Trichogramma kaykai TaxID=54128 RepID=A0ABD2XFK2_9HYME